MVVAIVLIISILVIPEGRPHWALRQGGYEASGTSCHPHPQQELNSLAPPTCSEPLLRTPPVRSTPTIKLVAHSLGWPLLRSKFHSPRPQLPFQGPQPKVVLSYLLLRIRKKDFIQGSPSHVFSLQELEAPSQGPSPPSLPEAQGSVRLTNKVPWQPGAGRVADGRIGRGRVAAAGSAPRPCREGLPIIRPIPRGLEGQACTWQSH